MNDSLLREIHVITALKPAIKVGLGVVARPWGLGHHAWLQLFRSSSIGLLKLDGLLLSHDLLHAPSVVKVGSGVGATLGS